MARINSREYLEACDRLREYFDARETPAQREERLFYQLHPEIVD